MPNHPLLTHLSKQRRVLAALAAWSVVEAAHTLTTGYALARALDTGFLAGRPATGLLWLAAAALAVVVGAYGTGRTFRGVAALVEPFRDALVRRVVTARWETATPPPSPGSPTKWRSPATRSPAW